MYNAFLLDQLSEDEFEQQSLKFMSKPSSTDAKLVTEQIQILLKHTKSDFTTSETSEIFQATEETVESAILQLSLNLEEIQTQTHKSALTENYACGNGGIPTATIVKSFAIGGGDADGDGVPDADDVCPNTDLGATVTVAGVDSGIANGLDTETGCSTADQVNAAVEDCSIAARNHGQFVSCFAKGVNTLKSSGVISGKEKGSLQSAAAKSDLP